MPINPGARGGAAGQVVNDVTRANLVELAIKNNNQDIIDALSAARQSGSEASLQAANDAYAAKFREYNSKSSEELLGEGLVSSDQYAAEVAKNDTSLYGDGERSDGSYIANPGASTEHAPGVTLDPAAYTVNQTQQNMAAWDADRLAQIDARDPRRFYADRAAIDEVTAQDAQFEAEKAATVAQGRNYFDPTGAAMTDAEAALNQAQSYAMANGGKSADQYDALGYLKGAAAGTAPSAAESMVLQSGNEQQRALAQQQLAADAATRRGSNDIRASQLSMAAGARGNLSGLARLQGANNTALSQAQLYQSSLDDTARRAIEANAARAATDNQAGLVRAQEMATARGQYADNSAAVRGQNLDQSGQLGSLAQQQAGLAGQQYSVDQAVLQNAQNNAQITNQANQFASQGNYTAAQANADRDLAAQQGNQQQDWNVAQANQNAAVQVQSLDDTAYGNVTGSLTDYGNTQQAAAIKLEQDYMGAVQQNAALQNNYDTGNATLVQQADQFEKERTDKIVGTAIGTVGTAAAALIGGGGSDERIKDIKRRVEPYDFSNAEDDVYSYKPEYQGKIPGADDQEHIGPMAQDLPDDVQYTVDGKRVVDYGRLALRLASSLGKVQRELKQARG